VNAKRLTTPQEKVRELQEKLGHAAKTNRKRKFHALYDKVYRTDVLQEAWRRVRSKKGAAGIDKQTLQDIEAMGVQEFLLACQKALREGSYRPHPVRREYIPKRDGRMRPLGIPTVRDRVIQMATKIVIEPIFEANFKECSYGFRPQRSTKQALERVRRACNRKGNWVVDVDIQGYFDNINQEKLMKLVAVRISDRRILKLIRKWLKAGVMEEGKVRHTELGIPQGGVISPLLANIYLNYFDTLWQKYGASLGELTRFADDFVIVCKTRKEAVRAIRIIKAIMARLELTLHPTKSRLVGMWDGKEGFDFLGMHHRKTREQTSTGKVYYTTKQWLTKKAECHIREVVKERLAPPFARVKSLESHIEYLNPKIRGWRNYYSTPHTRSKRKMADLDWYIVQAFTRWYAKKTKKRRYLSVWPKVEEMLCKQGLLKLA
jgi:RNA-directed DNA polymerase